MLGQPVDSFRDLLLCLKSQGHKAGEQTLHCTGAEADGYRYGDT